jgi:hypothetical protein
MIPRVSPYAIAAVVVGSVLSFTAQARYDGGRLAILITPNDGRPAIVQRGGAFEVIAREGGALHLVSAEREFEPGVEWRVRPDRSVAARCTAPVDMPPGLYALRLRAEDREDLMPRAVCVVDAIPTSYAFLHLGDAEIGAAGADAAFRGALDKAGGSGALFVFITGRIVHWGSADEMNAFFGALDTCALPTFVAPARTDGEHVPFEDVFGPDVFSFRVGDDAYLCAGSAASTPAERFLNGAGTIESLRRDLKAARWMIGFGPEPVGRLGVRTRLTLFVDDPADCYLSGGAGDTPRAERVPWRTWGDSTRTFASPRIAAGGYLEFQVSSAGIAPKAP